MRSMQKKKAQRPEWATWAIIAVGLVVIIFFFRIMGDQFGGDHVGNVICEEGRDLTTRCYELSPPEFRDPR